MNQSGPDNESGVTHSTTKSKSSTSLITSSSSCNSTSISNVKSLSNKVPTSSDISNNTLVLDSKTTSTTTPLLEDQDVIELTNQDIIKTSTNYAKSTKNESQFSILASSSAINNNQMSNDFSATKVPNNSISMINTSTKVPIAASCSSILSTTLMSATKPSVNVPISNECSGNTSYGNNNKFFTNPPSGSLNMKEINKIQNEKALNRINNSSDKHLSGISVAER